MTVTCPACGLQTQTHDVCEFCRSPIGPSAAIAPREILPRVQTPPEPAPVPPEDDPNIPIPVRPAPPRPQRQPQAVPDPNRPVARRVHRPPQGGKSPWPWILGISGGLVVLMVVGLLVAEAIARANGGSLLGGRRVANVKPTEPQDTGPSPEVLALEKAKITPLSDRAIKKFLEVAKLKSDMQVRELGCGDGRLAVRAAVDYGAIVEAWDRDPVLVGMTNRLAGDKGYQHRAKALMADDVLAVDLTRADVVFLVNPERWGDQEEVRKRLEPPLLKLKEGARFITTREVGPRHMLVETVPPDGPDRPMTIYVYQQ
jgi:hypothetical protein